MTIEIEFAFKCSKEKLFSYFTDIEKLNMWLVSNSEKTIISSRKNGKFVLYFNESHVTEGCKIVSFKKNELLEFTWKGPEQFGDFLNFEGELTTVKLSLNTTSSKTTKVTLIHYGWRSSEDYQKARKWHIGFWQEKLIKLEKLIEG